MWNHVHSSDRTRKWQPCPSHLQLQHPLFPFLQLLLSPNSITMSFTSSPSTALPFTKMYLLLFFSIIQFIQLKHFIHLICLLLIKVDADAGIMCEPCNGRGWLVCDFCKGQKTNIKAENKRIYRRCPSCKAVSHTLFCNTIHLSL